jgi:hypothetical protein
LNTRVNVMFPNDLLQQLQKRVPARKRSEFIVRATRDYMERERQREAIRVAAGAWNDPSQATLDTDEGIEAYLNESRRGWDERLQRLSEPE